MIYWLALGRTRLTNLLLPTNSKIFEISTLLKGVTGLCFHFEKFLSKELSFYCLMINIDGVNYLRNEGNDLHVMYVKRNVYLDYFEHWPKAFKKEVVHNEREYK